MGGMGLRTELVQGETVREGSAEGSWDQDAGR